MKIVDKTRNRRRQVGGCIANEQLSFKDFIHQNFKHTQEPTISFAREIDNLLEYIIILIF